MHDNSIAIHLGTYNNWNVTDGFGLQVGPWCSDHVYYTAQVLH